MSARVVEKSCYHYHDSTGYADLMRRTSYNFTIFMTSKTQKVIMDNGRFGIYGKRSYRYSSAWRSGPANVILMVCEGTWPRIL
jgi:hypothetical protein